MRESRFGDHVVVSRAREAGLPAYRYLVRGIVQGVGYRYFVARQADALGLTGYVRNRPDGSVEVVAAGSEQDLAQLEDDLRGGPRLAEVTEVEREPIPAPRASGFEIR